MLYIKFCHDLISRSEEAGCILVMSSFILGGIMAFSDTHAVVSTVHAVSTQGAKGLDVAYLYNKGQGGV